MDLSKFSTADLEALRSSDLSKVSTEGLLRLKEAMAAPQPDKAESALVKFGKDVARQVGLTARSGIEGVGNAVGVFSDPIGAVINSGINVTGVDAPKAKTAGSLATNFADLIGLPSAQNPDERIVSEATKMMAGAGGGIGLSSQVAKLPGLLGQAGAALSSNPVSQITGAAGGGLASQTAKETGSAEPWQIAAGFGGSLLGGAIPGALNAAKNNIAARLPAGQQQIELQITSALEKSGIDYKKLPFNIRQGLRDEVAKAMATGGTINPDALRRLADFKAVGMTPTQGMLSLDPVQLTREKNLSKITANSTNDSLRGLPELENQNNQAAIDFLNRNAGGAGDLYSAGQRAVGAINARDARAKSVENTLYGMAKDSSGRTAELSRSDFINKVDELLAASNKGAFLPDSISNMLNTISAGQITKNGKIYPVPFDVNTIDSLKTILATASRSTSDGNARAAIKNVRDALELTPLAPIKPEFGGNQVVTQGVGNAMKAADSLPQAALDAFDKARSFARARRTWQESSAGVKAAIDGATPDKFIETFFLKGTVDDATGVMREVKRSPEALAAMKQGVINFLKTASLNKASDEVGKFSQSTFNKELFNIGERKLALLFAPEELAQLKALGRASSYAQVQPVGSAVNNSNSGALVAGRFGDSMEGLLKAIPLGIGTGLADLSKNARISISTRGAKDTTQGLLTAPQEEQRRLVRGALPLLYGGLLSPP